jgi:hypothetical protein
MDSGHVVFTGRFTRDVVLATGTADSRPSSFGVATTVCSWSLAPPRIWFSRGCVELAITRIVSGIEVNFISQFHTASRQIAYLFLEKCISVLHSLEENSLFISIVRRG